MATNYPIVSIRNNATGHVFYCRTANFSTMGVNTGTVIHNTQFTVPAGAELGASQITVTANGIASAAVSVNIVAVKKIEIKELKVEIKELEVFTAAAGESSADPQLLEVVRALAERADQAASDAEAGQPFINHGERPEVGEGLTGPAAPASNRGKKTRVMGQ
jgi:hypothetical protein